ncbi:F-box/kelch-repeat protein At3g06240-like [Vicia villosa]|uniref:F-box/kelch-repeat protein At3g06240-like n=1 Tax=Vicia villosa TaxID=3911 RepID=UPI00273BE41D|nr:F-box/kelch-repeat protein At3g06240-like [Vicia villosa]
MMLLPEELIFQILLWLPVKSLIRFKCVCKSWFSLISHDSHFANSHFQLTSTTTPSHRILFISTFPFGSLSIDFEALLDDDTASVSLDLFSIFPQRFADIEIKGSCRGFILLCRSSNIYIWNPCTGVHREIPISPFGSNLNADYFYGFGYDPSTEDYLVVLMSRHGSDNPPLRLEYFSLKANTWNEVEGPHFPYANGNIFEFPPIPGGSLYNGAIHWLAFREDLQTEVIVAFDLMEKKLSYMLLPRCSDGSPLHCGLWVYGEFLSAYTTNYTNDTVVIFVMKEYKVDSSWTRTLALPYDVIPNEDFCPLCCTKNGDIVGTDDGSGLVKYDKNGQFLEHYCYTTDDLTRQMIMYIESLLSLPSDGDNQQV